MFEDRNRMIKIGIIIIFLIVLIFLIVKFISNIVSDYNESKQIAMEGIENIEDYIIPDTVVGETEVLESNLVKDYNTFYTIQTAFDNYIAALMNRKYEDTYSIVTQDIKSQYDKATYVQKITEFTQNNFISTEGDVYDNVDNLKNLYLIKENVYIGEILNAKGELVKIGVSVNLTNKTYRVFYVEM